VIDVELHPSGLDVARDIVRDARKVPVVMLGDVTDDEQLFAALEAGVSGYLPDDVDTSRLPPAIRAVLAGEAALPRRLVTRVVREFGARATTPRFSDINTPTILSRRQAQVLQLLAAHMSTAEIADTLYISRVTVRTHISAIFKKLDVPDRASAIANFRGVERKQRLNI
jgi:DNA-binding NarL/FixJ family response regulator